MSHIPDLFPTQQFLQKLFLMLLKILKSHSVRIIKVEMKLKQSGNEVGGLVVKYTLCFYVFGGCCWTQP